MRAIHKTNIFFGTQTIPVKISTVVRESKTGMSNACPHCRGDVGHINRCKDCSEEIAFADIRKAYKVSNDEKHIFAKEQLDTLKTKENIIEVIGTIDGAVDPRYITGSYYILPEKNVKPWAMLKAGIEESGKSVIVKYAMRGKTKIGCLIASDNVILMQTIAFTSQVVNMDENINATLTDKEADMGKGFVEKTLPVCVIDTIKDEYSQQIEALLEGNLEIVAPKPVTDETAFFKQ